MLLTPETENIQGKLASYCRTGYLSARIEGTREERLHHYRRLVFNTINDTLKRAFPITVKVLRKEEWGILVNAFFINHNCQTPQVWKLPEEFYEYYNSNPPECISLYPFLIDLLYFEWIEIEVHTMPDEVMPEGKIEGNWSTDVVLINPEYRIINLAYPVHMYKPEEVTQHQGQYYLFIYRDSQFGSVKFLNISPLHALVIMRISEEATLPTILHEASELFKITDTASLTSHIIDFLEDLKSKDVVLGFK